MKKILFLTLVLFSCYSAAAQEQLLHGKIKIDTLEAPVNIINVNTEKGTETSLTGEFAIKAKVGDTVLVSSVQYERREIKITPQMLKEGFLNVDLALDINRLDEVRLTNLTGNLETDLDKIKVVDMPVFNIGPVPLSPNHGVENAAFAENSQMPDAGGNILGLIGLITGNRNFGNLSGAPSEPVFTRRKANERIRAKFDNSFFIDHLHIELAYINDFLDYSFEHGLTEQLLRNDRSLDLIAFLERQSKSFLKETSEENVTSEMPG